MPLGAKSGFAERFFPRGNNEELWGPAKTSICMTLRRATLSQVFYAFRGSLDTRITHEDFAWIEMSDDNTALLKGEIMSLSTSQIRYLEWHHSLGDFRALPSWLSFNTNRHSILVGEVINGLKSTKTVFPRLQSLGLLLDLGHDWKGGLGFGLREKPELASELVDNLNNIITALRDLHLRSARMSIRFNFGVESAREEVDFRGLDSKKAARWITSEKVESRIFQL